MALIHWSFPGRSHLAITHKPGDLPIDTKANERVSRGLLVLLIVVLTPLLSIFIGQQFNILLYYSTNRLGING